MYVKFPRNTGYQLLWYPDPRFSTPLNTNPNRTSAVNLQYMVTFHIEQEKIRLKILSINCPPTWYLCKQNQLGQDFHKIVSSIVL